MHQWRHSELDGVGQTTGAAEAYLVYDGDCPFCSAYVRYVRVRENVRLRLINARHGGDLVDEIVQAGFDLDQGMVLKIGGRYYHGADCVNVLASLSSGSNAFNRINARIFRSPVLAGVLYPVLRTGRRIALALLGRSTFEPRMAATAKAAEPGRAERP
jgi:predicted DCC family thiol-disulfide oxidoreductase YuxK